MDSPRQCLPSAQRAGPGLSALGAACLRWPSTQPPGTVRPQRLRARGDRWLAVGSGALGAQQVHGGADDVPLVASGGGGGGGWEVNSRRGGSFNWPSSRPESGARRRPGARGAVIHALFGPSSSLHIVGEVGEVGVVVVLRRGSLVGGSRASEGPVTVRIRRGRRLIFRRLGLD